MAKDVERLVLELSADVGRLERGMRQAQRATEQSTRRIEKSFSDMQSKTTRSVSDMGATIRNTIAGIALGAAAREVGLYADAWTRASNSLLATGLSQEQTAAKMEELVAISIRSRSSLDSTITLYNRLIAASGELGVSQERVARVVETVNKALATSNMTGSERASAVTQLAQGLGSGTLAGDELKAIRENSQVLAQAIADEFGVTIGELKKLGSEGKLTSERVFGAIETATARIDAAFARTTGTISDSFTNLQTRATQFVGNLDQATGASAKFAETVNYIANNLDAFADAAVVAAAVVGGVLAGRAMVAAMTSFAALQASIAVTNAQLIAFEVTAGLSTGALGRMTVGSVAASAGMRGLSASMAFVGGPVGLAVIALAAGIALIAVNSGKAEKEARALADTIREQARAAGVASAEQANLTGEITATQSWAASLTNETHKLADAHYRAAAAAKAQAIEEARLRLETANTTLQQARGALAGRRQHETNVAGNTLSAAARSGVGPNGQPVGDVYGDARARVNQSREVDNVVAATAVVVAETANLNRMIGQGLDDYRTTPRTAGGGGDDGKAGGGRGASGPTPEELARAREILALQLELDRHKAANDTAEAARVQRLLDIETLYDQLQRAEVVNARAVATEQVDAVSAAERRVRFMEDAKRLQEVLDNANAEAQQAVEDEMDRQLRVQIELNRLAGNDAVVLMLERELELRRDIAALGPNASAAQVQRVRDDRTAINRAEDEAATREKAGEMARTFIDVIRADDIGAEIGNRFREAAFDGLEQILTQIIAQAMGSGGGQGGAGNGGWVSTVVDAIGSFFGGKRAMGGPVQAGKFYRVNENTPNSEFFAPKQDGWVGNIKQPRAAGRSTSVSIKQGDIYITGTGDAALRAYVDRAVAIGQRQTVAAVKAGAPGAQLERTLLVE